MYLAKNLQRSGMTPSRTQFISSVQNSSESANVPQTKPLHDEQVKNNASGYTFQVDDLVFFKRFLFLGTEKGTYYVSEADHTIKNVKCLQKLIKENRGEEILNFLLEVNKENRVAKSDTTLFSLAMMAKTGDVELKRKVYNHLSEFIRIPTQLFEFLEYSKVISSEMTKSKGWGRLQRQFVQKWYDNKSVDNLAYQVTKYQQRNGWSHRDVFRLTHLKPAGDDRIKERELLYKWIVKKELEVPEVVPDVVTSKTFEFLEDFAKMQKITEVNNTNEQIIVDLIRKHRFVREHIPTQFLNSSKVWDALLEEMPLNALIRNLNKLTNVNLLTNVKGVDRTDFVCDKLKNEEVLKKARIHPLKLLVAMLTYGKGAGVKGNMKWTPNQKVLDALNDAYYLSFKFAEPTGKRFLIGLDVSSSMGWTMCNNSSLNCREGAAALALTLMNMEKNVAVKMFSTTLSDAPLSIKRRLDDNIEAISNVPFGGTDLSLPITHALKNKIPVDCFIILSDNETWAGSQHPSECLRSYRKKMNIDARYVNIQMAANKFSCAEPDDVNSLEIAGFDAGMLETITEFLSWELM